MHDDLIDAVDWASCAGYRRSQARRVFGASYGGYSALTAATKTPEMFACIVNVFRHLQPSSPPCDDPALLGSVVQLWKNRPRDPIPKRAAPFLSSVRRSPISTRESSDPDRAGQRDVRVVAAESSRW